MSIILLLLVAFTIMGLGAVSWTPTDENNPTGFE